MDKKIQEFGIKIADIHRYPAWKVEDVHPVRNSGGALFLTG